MSSTGKTLKQEVKRIVSVFDILSVAISVIDIVAIIALAKVSLDRFFIIPRVADSC